MANSPVMLLTIGSVPRSLWDGQASSMHIAPALVDAYSKLIARYALHTIAADRDPENPAHGGLSEQDAKRQFAQAYGVSSARAQLALLDPNARLDPAAEACRRCLVGGKLSLTDAPSGSGASSLSFLATIAELRRCDILPRQPLHVHLILAEISDHSRRLASEMLNEMRQDLETQAIFIQEEILHWNVTDNLSNTRLIGAITRSVVEYPLCMLVISNFNHFMVRERRRTEADPQLEELFRHASNSNAVALWIEPDMNRATAPGGLLLWLQNKIDGVWRKFARSSKSGSGPILKDQSRFYPPLDPNENPLRVKIAIVKFELGRFND